MEIKISDTSRKQRLASPTWRLIRIYTACINLLDIMHSSSVLGNNTDDHEKICRPHLRESNQIKSILLVQNPVIGLSPVTYNTQIQIQSYREQYTIHKYVHVKHNYHSPIVTLDTCIRHISVAPLYIMGVKRWVQVCTCIDLSVQMHTQSNPSRHQIPVIACIWLAMTIILTGFI